MRRRLAILADGELAAAGGAGDLLHLDREVLARAASGTLSVNRPLASAKAVASAGPLSAETTRRAPGSLLPVSEIASPPVTKCAGAQMRDAGVELDERRPVRRVDEGARAPGDVAGGIGGLDRRLVVARHEVQRDVEAAVGRHGYGGAGHSQRDALLGGAAQMHRAGAQDGTLLGLLDDQEGRRAVDPDVEPPDVAPGAGQAELVERRDPPVIGADVQRTGGEAGVLEAPSGERHLLEIDIVGDLEPIADRILHRGPAQRRRRVEQVAVVRRRGQLRRRQHALLLRRLATRADQGPLVAAQRHRGPLAATLSVRSS